MTALPMCAIDTVAWPGTTSLGVHATLPPASGLTLPVAFLKLSNFMIGRPFLWGTEAAGMFYRQDVVDALSAVHYGASNVGCFNMGVFITDLFSQVPSYLASTIYNLSRDDWRVKITRGTRDEALVSYLQAPAFYLMPPRYTHTESTTCLDALAVEDIYFNLTTVRLLNNFACLRLEELGSLCVLFKEFFISAYFLVGFIGVFLANLLFFLLLTLIIATITLMERKLLALVQRRVGPNYIGYRGRFQFIADAVKLLVKHIVILQGGNRILFLLTPPVLLILCYLFWVNLVWGPSLALCEVEYNLLFMTILSLIFSYLLFIVGWVSKNKYAILSSNRMVITTLNLEILLNFMLLVLLLCFESFSFLQVVGFQAYKLWTVFICLPILPLIIITFLLETGRIPFDLGEAESELIAGYTTEMGGFFFALFYLGEYFHLFCFAVVYVLCFFGGWL